MAGDGAASISTNCRTFSLQALVRHAGALFTSYISRHAVLQRGLALWEALRVSERSVTNKAGQLTHLSSGKTLIELCVREARRVFTLHGRYPQICGSCIEADGQVLPWVSERDASVVCIRKPITVTPKYPRTAVNAIYTVLQCSVVLQPH